MAAHMHFANVRISNAIREAFGSEYLAELSGDMEGNSR